MLTWILSKWSWKSFAIGAGTALFGGTIARPALVGAVKTGLELRDRATETLAQARYEAAKIHAEAARQRAMEYAPAQTELISELQKLREEIASIKGAYGPKAPKP